MKHISELPLLKEKKDWLVAGKGPSFANLTQEMLDTHLTIALNHAIEEAKFDVAHAIDLEVLLSCQEAICNNSRYLVLPLHLHIDFSPTEKTLCEFLNEHQFLQKLSNEDRLFWYNSSTWSKKENDYPIIPVWFFSADAVIALLAYNGVKKIRTSKRSYHHVIANSTNDLN